MATESASGIPLELIGPSPADPVSAYETALDRLQEAARHVDVVIPGQRRRCPGSPGGATDAVGGYVRRHQPRR